LDESRLLPSVGGYRVLLWTLEIEPLCANPGDASRPPQGGRQATPNMVRARHTLAPRSAPTDFFTVQQEHV